MADLNSVNLVGRITKDPEMKYTQSSVAILNFTIAVNTSKKENGQWVEKGNFFNLKVFGKRAESLQNYLKKGKQVAVTGHLEQNKWEKDGVNHYSTEVCVDDIYLLGGGKSEGGTTEPPAENGGAFPEDIPFE